MKRQKIYLYLDESGRFHENSNRKYFSIGGFFTKKPEPITSSYRKINKKMKIDRGLTASSDVEIKSYHMTNDEKTLIFKRMQNRKEINPFCKVFDRKNMRKKVLDENLFYNYGVRVIFEDYILPELELNTPYHFEIAYDQRGTKIPKSLDPLEKFLTNVFGRKYNITFKCIQYDSKNNFNIQLADLFANTGYLIFHDYETVQPILKDINFKKYKASIFPGNIPII